MRANAGGDSADFAELLAVSGCRKSEIGGCKKYGKPPMLWRDINRELRVFTVTKSKNHCSRTVPLFPAMEKFLRDLQARLPEPPRPDDRIISIDSAKKAIETACRQLGYPKYGHHTCRHFFCSNAIEKGIDFKVIADWVGNNDGDCRGAGSFGRKAQFLSPPHHPALIRKSKHADKHRYNNRTQ